MKIITYNVNGVRSATNKGLVEWLQSVDVDVVCLQEIKAQHNDIPQEMELLKAIGYSHQYWYPAQKKGYSGVAILSKVEPKNIEFGCGNAQYDNEGRILRVDFNQFSLLNVYIPSGSSGDERQAVKYEFLDFFNDYIDELKEKYPKLLIVGDYNICHKPIDIHNPKTNAKSSGFLPEEREWMEKFIQNDMIDAFRQFNQEPHQYTWWSFRSNARAKNMGWRIDYQIATNNMSADMLGCEIWADVKLSDHCPVMLELSID